MKSKLIENKKLSNKKIVINYHMFFLICKNLYIRTRLLTELKKNKVFSTFHYIPLHKSEFGSKYFKKKLVVTEELSKKIIRLPLWIGMNQNFILNKIKKILND